MTSRQIIIKLIDENKVTGEEAFELMNSIIIAEMEQAKEVLAKCAEKKLNNSEWNNIKLGEYIYPTTTTTSAQPNWITPDYTVTLDSNQYTVSTNSNAIGVSSSK